MKKLIFIGIFICLIGFATAGFPFNDYPTKWALCNALNFTGISCDIWWEAFADIPEANATTIDLSSYYNKTEVDLIISKVNMTGNLTNLATIDLVENKTGELRNNIVNNFVSNATLEARMKAQEPTNTTSGGTNTTTIVIIVAIALVAVIVGLNFMQRQNRPVPPTRIENPITNRIKSRQQLEQAKEEVKEETQEPDKYEKLEKEIQNQQEMIKQLKKELKVK